MRDLVGGFFVLIAIAGVAAGQVSPEEAQRRLDQRMQQRAPSDAQQLQDVKAQLEQARAEIADLRFRLDRLLKENHELKAATQPTAASDRGLVIARAGDVTVKLLDHGVGKIRIKGFGGEADSGESLFWVRVQIENHSANKKADYQTWNGKSASFERDYAVATDENGNVYKRVDFGLSPPVGAIRSESIYPGQSIVDRLIFERPVPGAKTINLELPGRNIGSGEDIKVDVPLSGK